MRHFLVKAQWAAALMCSYNTPSRSATLVRPRMPPLTLRCDCRLSLYLASCPALSSLLHFVHISATRRLQGALMCTKGRGWSHSYFHPIVVLSILQSCKVSRSPGRGGATRTWEVMQVIGGGRGGGAAFVIHAMHSGIGCCAWEHGALCTVAWDALHGGRRGRTPHRERRRRIRRRRAEPSLTADPWPSQPSTLAYPAYSCAVVSCSSTEAAVLLFFFHHCA